MYFNHMNDTAIKVEQLSKVYKLYDNHLDRLKEAVHPKRKKYHRDFYALNDLSFEVKKGETIGIIGSNGSGKSTLLKILTGVLSPTAGNINTNGKISALLELGTGFNPEFTGIENIYFSGTIMGYTKVEIDERLQQIIEFADIGDFISQPVKCYSSGMFVRLAFAVAINVNPDIFIIDEALSVGDATFTQKCMRYIREYQRTGTLLFVSHDMASVINLCSKGIWLNKGEIQMIGPSKEVAEAYLQHTLQEVYGDNIKLSETASPSDRSDKSMHSSAIDKHAAELDYESEAIVEDNFQNSTGWKTGTADLLSVSLEKLEPGPDKVFTGGEKVCIVIRARANEMLAQPAMGFMVKDRLGQDLFGENTIPFTAINPVSVKAGQEFCSKFYFKMPMLPNGQYSVMASVADGDLHNNVQHHFLHDALIINVSSSKIRYGLIGIPFERATLEVNDA